MKPKDLIHPFESTERQVLIHDRVWYIPGYYSAFEAFTFPGWDHPTLFGNSQPICLEYCSGNGDWIVDRAERYPNKNWVAVEKRFDRVRKIWSKMKNHELDNLIIICGEGYTATKHYFPNDSVSEVYVNFPDPWPKKRHAKNRLIQSAFLEEVGRILVDVGSFMLVTDDPDYSHLMVEEVLTNGGYQPVYPSPHHYQIDMPDYGSSYFMNLWKEKGREIRYHQFSKKRVG